MAEYVHNNNQAEAASDTPAIIARGVSRSFGPRKAVDDVSFELPEKAFLSIFGPNGAGKTTLLKVLSTLLPITGKGSASVAGFDVKTQADELRRRLGIISHNPLLYPDLSAEENLRFFADLYCIPNPEERIDELFEAVELKHRRYDVVRGFSRGMTQRMSIARALLPKPEVLFLDEPYSGLDPHASEILDSLIANIRGNHTFVMVSHDLDKGLELASHALILSRGQIVLYDKTDNIEKEAFRGLYRKVVGLGVS
ncbi:MAG: ABC transporter ATP-binding protein [Coriobacteriia bacterium]|nr:ABC transporter ATP-binding protein [Coriobacteriia bacterium]MCL2537365.1 ABC transporter ATP-binding protein [Coriobacteriia bacterium]